MSLLNSFPDDARVWVYASNRLLTANEQEQINHKANQFINGWSSHERKMDASFQIIKNLFLVLALNESQHAASGCGIDKSVAFFKSIESDHGISLFNRLQIEVETPEGMHITNKSEVSQWLKEGKINAQTKTFNKQVTTKHQFDQGFQIPLSEAWFFQSVSAQPSLA